MKIADADKRFEFLYEKYKNVIAIKIDSTQLRKGFLELETSDGESFWIPIWSTADDDGWDGTAFVSTRTMRKYPGVDQRISQLSEWFALDHIPMSMIRQVYV